VLYHLYQVLFGVLLPDNLFKLHNSITALRNARVSFNIQNDLCPN
jgi:hypothetical protein